MPPERAPATSPGRHPLRIAGRSLVVLAAAALIALLGYGLLTQSPDTTIDDGLARGQAPAAPGFDLAVLQRGDPGARLAGTLAAPIRDGRVTLRELRGAPVVLNFWASWCGTCREEAPLLQRTWLSVARPRGVLMLGLDMQDVVEDARASLRDFAVSYPNIRDLDNATSRRYGATGLPETFFISARGRIVGHVIGRVTPEQLTSGIQAAATGRPIGALIGGALTPTR